MNGKIVGTYMIIDLMKFLKIATELDHQYQI